MKLSCTHTCTQVHSHVLGPNPGQPIRRLRVRIFPHLTSQNVQARELRAMATSLAFHQHHSLKQVMEAASWRVDSTFASFYLRDLTPAHLRELGPLVAGQSVISDR